ERHAVDDALPAVVGGELDGEVADGHERRSGLVGSHHLPFLVSRPSESRMPSPSRLNDSTVSMIAMPGGNAWNFDVLRLRYALCSIEPQLDCGGWTANTR